MEEENTVWGMGEGCGSDSPAKRGGRGTPSDTANSASRNASRFHTSHNTDHQHRGQMMHQNIGLIEEERILESEEEGGRWDGVQALQHEDGYMEHHG